MGNLQRVRIPISIHDLLQIKAHLGSYSDDPEKYTDGFWSLTLTFDLTWKDIHVIIGQTLSKAKREMIMETAIHDADLRYMTDPNYPFGATAIPTTNPNWDYNILEDTWQ